MADDAWGSSLNDPVENSDSAYAEDSDDFGFGTEDMSKDDLTAGNKVKLEGWYHFAVTKITDDLNTVKPKTGMDQMPKFIVELTVQAAEDGLSKPGAKLTEYLFMGDKGGGPAPDWARQKFARFALGTGIMVEVDGKLLDAKTMKPRVTKETVKGLTGKHLIGKCVFSQQDEEDEKKYGKRCELFFCRAYHPNDPAVKDVPKDWEALRADDYDPDVPAPFVWDAEEVKAEEEAEKTNDEVPADLDAI